MFVCIVIAGRDRSGGKLKALAEGLSQGLQAQGHTVDIVNIYSEQPRLTMYDYVIVGSEPVSALSATIPDGLKKYLSGAGAVSGKRCFAFISGCLRKGKTLHNLMRIMESEGMMLKSSEVITKKDEAIAIGKRLRVERNI